MNAPDTTPLERAKALFSEGKLKESEEAYKQVVESGSNVAEGYYGLGLVRGQMRDWDGAARYFEMARKEDPRHANAHFQLGFVAEQRGAWREAMGYYEEALRINPQLLGAQQRLELLRDYERAQARAQQPTMATGPQPAYAQPAPPRVSRPAVGGLRILVVAVVVLVLLVILVSSTRACSQVGQPVSPNSGVKMNQPPDQSKNPGQKNPNQPKNPDQPNDKK